MNDEGKKDRRRILSLALRIAGSVLGLAYVLSLADPAELLSVALSLPAHVPPLVFAVMAFGLLIGTLRWRVVLWAYGAVKHPSLMRLYYLYLVALFYNSFLPGGLGGDVIRGLVGRESFGEAGVTRSLTVVFVERVLGLAGLLLVAGTVLVVHPLPGFTSGTLLGLAGVAGAVAAVLGIAAGRRLSDSVPAFIGRKLAKLPPLEKPSGLLGGLGLSLATQVGAAVSGFLVLGAVEPSITFLDALVIVPVASAAAFFPLTVGGAGAREAAFVVLCSLALGMDAADAAASSLVLFAIQLALGAVGGLLQLAIPLEQAETP
jgi:uncharacterized membrane protein YbhN (UPF0104 family)